MPRTHRTYEKDFRQEAVNLLLSSGRPLKRVAAELGISANSLRTWRDRALGKGCGAEAAAPQAKGRSGLGWFLLSLLMGPLATLLIVLFPDRRR